MNNKIPVFSGIDSSYSLPDNVAMITLQASGECLAKILVYR